MTDDEVAAGLSVPSRFSLAFKMLASVTFLLLPASSLFQKDPDLFGLASLFAAGMAAGMALSMFRERRANLRHLAKEHSGAAWNEHDR